MPRLSRILLGLVCGWLLSRLRLVPGESWFDGPAVAAESALFVRGAALVLVGLALRPLARGANLWFLIALALGHAGHGLLLGRPLGLPGWDVLIVAVVLGLASWSAGRARTGEDDADAPTPVQVGERIGLFLAGGAAALVLEVVARHLRLLGGGLAQDDSAFGSTFLVLVLIGGACFGWIASLRLLERWSAPFCLAAAAAGGYAGIATLERIGQLGAFDRFLRQYGLDSSWHATIGADALLAGASLVLPAFLIGMALRGARGAGSLSSILVGAGCGLAIIPWLLRGDPAASTGTVELFSAQLLPFGVLTAVLGAGLAMLSLPGRSARARWLTCAAALPLALPVLLVPAKPLFLLSPWEKMPTLPFLAFETSAGLATVETGRGGLKLATLDRVALSPGLEGVRAEQQQIQSSFAALSPEVRAGHNVRVLLVGQLTQMRAAQIVEQDAGLIDRTAAWHEAMPRLEGELLQDYPLPPGEILAPREAEERFLAGGYDLVIALAARGDPPAWRRLSTRPATTVVARWSALREPMMRGLPASTFAGDEESLYALAGSGLQELSLGVLDGATRAAPDAPRRPELVRLDRATPAPPTPLARLLLRKTWRPDVATRAVTDALAQDGGTSLVRGLAEFWNDQVPSSPYETESEQIELDGGVLALLREAALAAPPSIFVRGAWEWLARVLVGKRDIAAIEAFVAPVSARWAPWPELEVALARADLEALDPEAARRRLQPFSAVEQPNFELLTVLGQACEQAGDLPAAVQAHKAAAALRPTDRGARRRLAVAQVRAGDPEGLPAIRALLQEDPADDELKPFLGPGPWPHTGNGYTPGSRPH